MLKKRLGAEAIERSWPDDDCSLEDYYKVPSTLIIPEGCVRIGHRVFTNCTSLKEVIISEGCKSIGIESFSGCRKLEKLVIREGVTVIEISAFSDCKELREVIIPESVEMIGSFAFKDCWNAEIIVGKPESEFEYFGYGAFDGCKRVKLIIVC